MGAPHLEEMWDDWHSPRVRYHDAVMIPSRTHRLRGLLASGILPALGIAAIILMMVLGLIARLFHGAFRVHAADGAPVVVRLSIHDTIQPITAEYLKRGLDDAAARHADAALISMG